MTNARTEEEQFYSRYTWCLNPVLSVEHLLLRLQEEVDHYPSLAGWQREESTANLYLFTCAVACTVDDYLASQPLNLSILSKRFSQSHLANAAVQTLMDAMQSATKVRDRAIWKWRRQWNECIEQACALLLCDPVSGARHFQTLRRLTCEQRRARLPSRLLKRRMRLPEAFRSQDMAHQDVLALIQQFCASFTASDRPTVIMGLRTAGAYFAPLMAQYLKTQRWQQVSWCSVRPKNGTAAWERQELENAAKNKARLLVVDDYPATGNTLRVALDIVRQFGIPPDRTVILAPTHVAEPNWVQLVGIDARTPVITIQLRDLYKNSSLNPNNVAGLCREYYATEGSENVCVLHDDEIDRVNACLARHSTTGHHVREKRVFNVAFSGTDGEERTRKILFKSVGWGWLGYHAYIAGRRLDGFVPHVIGLRNGLLAMEWIDAVSEISSADSQREVVKILASYVAARSRRLRLSGDCHLERRTYRWTGFDEMLVILRSVYGRFINRLKMPALREELYKYHAAAPTLIDGRMRPEEWIQGRTGFHKTDFEHHNFGGGELDIVDPAYDLAAAIFEFRLSRNAEQDLLRIYRQECDDASVADRILIHKILYGSLIMRYAFGNVVSGREPEKNNAVYHEAKNFLVYCLCDFSANVIHAAPSSHWSGSLFFMDLDGVFDQQLLGFPHPTQNGLVSLAQLRAGEFSVVINTRRSVQHVRHYCNSYGLAGGAAEFGAVFIDAIHHREIPLVDEAGLQQLAECREAMKSLPDVFIDPCYEYSIRAYRYSRSGTVGLNAEDIQALLASRGFARLTFICRAADTYIVQKDTSKGAAVEFIRNEVGGVASVTAIGYSAHDVGMLKAADFAYAPANCARAVRDLAKHGKCRILRQSFQNGLLAAVRDTLPRERFSSASELLPHETHRDYLMQSMLKIADRGVALRLFGLLSWWSL